MQQLFLILLITCSFTRFAEAADNPVPQVVARQFAQRYPGVEVALWEDQGNGHMAAHFPSAQGLKTAVFHANGQWIYTSLRLNPILLPEGIYELLRQPPHGARLTFSGKVFNDDQSWYRLEYELQDRLIRRDVDGQGQLLREEVISYSLPATTALP
ncbi:MAG: hypothetical protein KDC54_09735 [Lewinella sp.]|nr:hypothetical protein [Lewinella sp.]